jgi:hypothetical protein
MDSPCTRGSLTALQGMSRLQQTVLERRDGVAQALQLRMVQGAGRPTPL